VLPPEITQLSEMEELLEFPPIAWSAEFDSDPEVEECALIAPDAWARMRSPDAPPPGMQTDVSPPASTERPLIEFSSSDSESSPPLCDLADRPLQATPQVGSSPTASSEITVVPDSPLEEDASAATAFPEDVEPAAGVWQNLATVRARPAEGQAESTLTPVEGDDDSDVNPDLPFERGELKAAQAADDGLSAVIAYCKDGHQPSKDDVRTLPEEAKELLFQWESLLVEDDILYRRFQHVDGATKYLQLVLPGKLRRVYLERLHVDLGHFGQAKTCEAVARRVYFPGWRQYTKLIVKRVLFVINRRGVGRP